MMAVLMLSSCIGVKKTPYYKTDYTYIQPEPKTEINSLCISQCGSSQSQCKQNEEMMANDRRREDEQKANECRKTSKPGLWSLCNTYSIGANYGRCTNEYNNCFTTCGGKVTSETVCVSNCNVTP